MMVDVIAILAASTLLHAAVRGQDVMTGVCSSANGYACLNRRTYATCKDYKIEGVATTCPPATPNCFPGQPPNTPICGPNVPCVDGEFGNFSMPGRCRNFITCIPNVPGVAVPTYTFLSACPEGQEFSPSLRRCTAAVLAGCSQPLPSAPPGSCSLLNLLRREQDPASCRHFYKCTLFGTLARVECPQGLLFDANLRTCRVNTDCGNRPR